MKKYTHSIFLVVFLFIAILLSGCDSGNSNEDASDEAPTAAPVSADETEEAPETEEPVEETQEAPAPPTIEAIVTSEAVPMSNVSDNGDFAFVVATVIDPYEAEDLTPPTDLTRIVMLRVALTNNSEAAITSDTSSVKAVDNEGIRYTAEAPVKATEPTLIDVEIAPGETFTGFVHFIVPNSKEVVGVEWCPTSNCSQPLSMTFR